MVLFLTSLSLLYCSNALEELSVRAGIALVQKKVMHDIMSEGNDDDEFDREYTALSAQVVSLCLCHGLKRFVLSHHVLLAPLT
jgi:hypothetical protein